MLQSDGYGFKRVSKKQMQGKNESVQNSKSKIKSSKVVLKSTARSITYVKKGNFVMKNRKFLDKRGNAQKNNNKIVSVKVGNVERKSQLPLAKRTVKKIATDKTGMSRNFSKMHVVKNSSPKNISDKSIHTGRVGVLYRNSRISLKKSVSNEKIDDMSSRAGLPLKIRTGKKGTANKKIRGGRKNKKNLGKFVKGKISDAVKSTEDAIKESADQTVGTQSLNVAEDGLKIVISHSYKKGVKYLRKSCLGIQKAKRFLKDKTIKIRKGKKIKNVVCQGKQIECKPKIEKERGNEGTFAYLNDANNQTQYTYQFKRKKENAKGLLKADKPNNELVKANVKQLKKDDFKLEKTTRSIKSARKVKKAGKNKGFKRNNAYKKIKEERETVGNAIVKSIVDILLQELKRKLASKFVPAIVGFFAVFLITLTPIVAGPVIILEGYALVVEFVEDVVDTAKDFFANIKDFAGDTWDSIRSTWTDTHGAGKVNLDDMMSVDEFMKSMCEYERNKINDLKTEYERLGYKVVLYHSGQQVMDSVELSGDSFVATGGSEFNGASKETIKYCWEKIRAKGFTEEATAGLIGNMCQETTGINPMSGSSHFGIIQWQESRKEKMISWCNFHGYSWTTVEGQLQYVLQSELKGWMGEKRYNEFKKMKDVIKAADYICIYYEGAKGQQQPERRKYAQNAYKLCAGTQVMLDMLYGENTSGEEIDEEENDYEITLESLYSEDEYAKILKPLWLSVMYGEYEYEPTEMEMAETAEDIGDILNSYSVDVDSDTNTVTIYIYNGSVDEVLQKYYLDELEELKDDEDRQEEYMKLQTDYDMAKSLLEYYETYDVVGESSGTTNSTSKKAVDEFFKKYGVRESSENEKINNMIKLGLSKVGNKYVYGGTDIDNGIDCSGFTQWCYKQIGVSLPRTSSAQSTVGKEVNKSAISPGDLCFYGSGGTVNHVALYIGGGKIVHASNKKPYPAGGIKIAKWDYRPTLHIRRIIE